MKDINKIKRYFLQITNYKINDYCENSFNTLLKKFEIKIIKEAFEIVYDRYSDKINTYDKFFQLVYGVCRNKINKIEEDIK